MYIAYNKNNMLQRKTCAKNGIFDAKKCPKMCKFKHKMNINIWASCLWYFRLRMMMRKGYSFGIWLKANIERRRLEWKSWQWKRSWRWRQEWTQDITWPKRTNNVQNMIKIRPNRCKTAHFWVPVYNKRLSPQGITSIFENAKFVTNCFY